VTQVFLLSPGGNWADPGNFNPINTVEVVGTGGTGGAGGVQSASGSGAGGGGGAYAKGINLTPTFPVSCVIQAQSTISTQVNGFAILSGNFIPAAAPGTVWAQCGWNAGAASGGGNGTQFYPAGFSGGRGGSAVPAGGPELRASTSDKGGGGGGAGGPLGIGATGALGNSVVAGAGGAANNGTVAGGAIATNGTSDTTWDATHGIGSGGGGATLTAVAGRAGSYGGGGGGGSAALGFRPGGVCGAGLIIITYIPVEVPSYRTIVMCS
jgi:hypothetical protein